jgi:hypothetical protein
MISSYPNYKPMDMAMTVDTWQAMLADYEYPVISKALQKYILNDKTGFAPSIGQVIANIEISEPRYKEPLEAWSLVRKAICNSTYHADEEFEKLPIECQVAIGSASNLKELAQMPTDTVESVEQSHFIRSYQGVVKRLDDERRLPPQYKTFTAQIAEQIKERKALTVKEEPEEITEVVVNNDRIPIAELMARKKAEKQGVDGEDHLA